MSDDALHDDPAPASDEPAVAAVLQQLGVLRLRLSADLGVVASAVELAEHRIALDVLDGVSADLTCFTAGLATPVPPAVPLARRRHVLRAALPAAPALAAAAALVAVLAGVVPARGPVAPAATPAPDVAAASYADLFRLHERGARAAADRVAVDELHAQVARVMAAAWDDPAGAETALLRLAAEAGRVEDADQRADLRAVLAESQRLLAGVQDVLAAATPGLPPLPPAPAALPGPVLPGPGLPATPAPEVAPPPAPEPPPGSATPSPAATPSAAATPSPSLTTPGMPGPQPTGSPTQWFGPATAGGQASVALPRRRSPEE